MTNNTLDQMEVLQIKYGNKLPLKIDEIEQAWQRLSQDWDALAWTDFHRLVHSLHGSAGMFGFEQVGLAAGELEKEINAIKDPKNPTEEEKTSLLTLLSLLKRTVMHK